MTVSIQRLIVLYNFSDRLLYNLDNLAFGRHILIKEISNIAISFQTIRAALINPAKTLRKRVKLMSDKPGIGSSGFET